MFRIILYIALLILFARAMARLWTGVMQGMGAAPGRNVGVPHGVHMVRDPVCGTFVLPSRAIRLAEGRAPVYFCSDSCRAKYRSETASGRTA